MAIQTLGVEAGDGFARAVIVDEQGTVLRRAESRGSGSDLEAAITGIAGTGPDAWTGIAAAGVSIEPPPGAWVGFEFPGLETVMSVPGIAAVTAEAWVGAARGARTAICLVIGHQVTAGILLDGQPWSGAHGRAGAAAWLTLNPVERQDYRQHGSLAAEVSSPGIARRLSWRIQAGDHSAVLERAGDLESITAAHVFEGARTGDGVSISVVRDTAKYIGMAIANLAVAIDPEVIVISGAVAAATDLMLDPVRQEFVRRLPPGLGEQIRVEMSPLGEDGVAIGAARLAMRAGV
jgi:glucokinase